MKKQSKTFLVLATIAVSIAACSIVWSTVFPSGTWRYKITVNVETPEGIKTGSAVRQVTVKRGIRLSPEVTPDVKLSGEAVAVDLGQRGVLFGVLDPDDHRIVFNAFPFSQGGTTKEGIKYYSHLKNAKTELGKKLYPHLVKFRDLKDPITIEEVDPDNLAASFGEGVKLNSITLEMTNEPILYEIERYLPWLQDYFNKMLDGQRFNNADAKNPLANSLSSGAFSTKSQK